MVIYFNAYAWQEKEYVIVVLQKTYMAVYVFHGLIKGLVKLSLTSDFYWRLTSAFPLDFHIP